MRWCNSKCATRKVLFHFLIFASVYIIGIDILVYISKSHDALSLRWIYSKAVRLTRHGPNLKGSPENGERSKHKKISDKKTQTIQSIEECLKKNVLYKDRTGHSKSNTTDTQFACTHLMTTGSYGRIGNQMFSVANLLGTSHYHGYTAVIRPSMAIANIFDLPNLSIIKIENAVDFRAQKVSTYDNTITNLNHSHNYTFQRFFHSWRYFEGSTEIVKRAFKFKNKITEKATDYLRRVSPKGSWKVGIHVRRGDFLNSRGQKLGMTVAPIEYIIKAMHHFRRKHPNVFFIVLSDDKNWCSQNLCVNNVTISPFISPELDLAVMSLCDSVIMTQGTFGWWGGWLSGGDVVYYKGFPRKGSNVSRGFDAKDRFPSNWIGLD